MRVLLAEDDAMIGDGVRRGLAQDGFAVDWVRDGRAAELALGENVHDLLLLDLGLPRRDGLAVLQSMRQRGDKRPVLVLTARDAVTDRVAGLDAGADDYLTKPFSPRELVARVKAVLRRRAPQATDDAVEAAGLVLDPASHRVLGNGTPITLGPTEFRMLHFLMTHAERVHTRAQLLDQVWGDHIFVEERTVDVHIRRLRKALEYTGHDRLIKTVRSAGYRFSENA